MTDEEREFDEQVAADRRQVVSRCRAPDRPKVELALDRLIAFSRLHSDVLEPIDTSDLDRVCIGFTLRGRDQVLWKVYATSNTLEVLIRAGKSLTAVEYGEFLGKWRRIPGQVKKPERSEEVPSLNVGAVANDAVWHPLEACLEWAITLSDRR